MNNPADSALLLDLPPYWRRKKPNYWRRAKWHDYRARSIYMFTMVKADSMPSFGALVCDIDPNTAINLPAENARTHFRCNPSPLGQCVADAVSDIALAISQVRILRSVIMPDHIHLLVYFTQNGLMHAGEWVQRLKSTTTRFWRRTNHWTADIPTQSVFVPQYHDRIIMSHEQCDRVRIYIQDNPRRLWMKRYCREYFRQCGSIEINGKLYNLFGNPRILDYPFKNVIQAHMSDSETVLRQRITEWAETGSKGEVMVTPAVHPAEREGALKAVDEGGALILIHNNGFGPKFKPEEPWFELCAKGRLLIVGETAVRTNKLQDFRSKCKEMNAVAASIAAEAFRRQ